MKDFTLPLLEPASPRIDQRKAPPAEGDTVLMRTMERKILMQILKQLDQKTCKIAFSAGDFVAERKNPIERTYEIFETIGKGGFGEVKRIKHKQLNVTRALKIIRKDQYSGG